MYSNIRESRRKLGIVFISLSLVILIISVGFAALSSTLNITTSNVTQTPQEWDVGFQEETVEPFEMGTSTVGRNCPPATATKTSITIGEITLSKPDDSCGYSFIIRNSGTIPADLDSITFTEPLEQSCTGDISSKICGNITYQLYKNRKPLTTENGSICADNYYNINLIIEYTGDTLASSQITQTSGKFTLNFVQGEDRECDPHNSM